MKRKEFDKKYLVETEETYYELPKQPGFLLVDVNKFREMCKCKNEDDVVDTSNLSETYKDIIEPLLN